MSNHVDKIEIGSTKLPSILKDPFCKSSITGIQVTFQDFWNDGKWKATGWVKFKNDNTSGCQDFQANTFDEVVLGIKSFIETLQKHP